MAVLAAASYSPAPLLAWIKWTSERDVRVDGPWHASLLSLHPRVAAERVTIKNPAWVQPGTLAEIDRLTISFRWPLPWRRIEFRDLRIEGAHLDVIRDASGHANWQWRDDAQGGGGGPPLIRHLLISGTHAQLDDALRHLQFDGTLGTAEAGRLLRIAGSGQLNGAAVRFTLEGDPLSTVTRDRAYAFRFDEHSRGSHLVAKGALARPFDLRRLNVHFEANGDDLKDVYYLVGLSLLDTGPYHVTGDLAREGSNFRYTSLSATSGQSDMHGSISIDSSSKRPQIQLDLSSLRLRLADLGARAAGRAPAPTSDQPLFTDTPLPLRGVRHGDTVTHFRAERLDVGRTSWRSVAAQMTINGGRVRVRPFSAKLADGMIKAELTIDASKTPQAELTASVHGVQLARLFEASPTPLGLAGPLLGQLHFKAAGATLHEMAASLDGQITAVVPSGSLRASSAELAGLNLGRGLGLLAIRDPASTELRCAVASFDARAGVLIPRSLIVDTEPVLITGDGRIDLHNEKLNLTLRGRPKHLRLMRARAPLLVRGSLRHPSIQPEVGSTLLEAGEAAALGVLLTPVAAVLASVDPGLAKDADCQALLAQAGTAPGQGKESAPRAQ